MSQLQDLRGVQPGVCSSWPVSSPRHHQDRLSAITDKAGAGVLKSSRVQGGQVVHQARLGVLGDSVQSLLWCIIVIAACNNVVVPNLYTTGQNCAVGQCESF